MNTILHHCQKDLELWASRLDHHIPTNHASKLGKRWKRIIIVVDKPKLMDLTTRISQYIDQIDAMLGVIRG
jgi:hypothetical protein